jgi:hypothetical protein
VLLITQINAEKSAKICGICGKLKFRLGLPCDPSNIQIVQAVITIAFYSSFFLEKKGPKIQASLKANAKAPEKCGAACTIFCALAIWATACRYKPFKIVQPPYQKQKITVPLHFSFRW